MNKLAYLRGYLNKEAGSVLREAARMGSMAPETLRMLQARGMLPSAARAREGLRQGNINIARQYGLKLPAGTRMPVNTLAVKNDLLSRTLLSGPARWLLSKSDKTRHLVSDLNKPTMTPSEWRVLLAKRGIGISDRTLRQMSPVITRHELDEVRIGNKIKGEAWKNAPKFKWASPIGSLKDRLKGFQNEIWRHRVAGHISPEVLAREAQNTAYMPGAAKAFLQLRKGNFGELGAANIKALNLGVKLPAPYQKSLVGRKDMGEGMGERLENLLNKSMAGQGQAKQGLPFGFKLKLPAGLDKTSTIEMAAVADVPHYKIPKNLYIRRPKKTSLRKYKVTDNPTNHMVQDSYER